MKKSVVLLFSLLMIGVSCASRLTNENLMKIKNGMSQKEVIAVLGEPTSKETGQAIGISGTTFYYKTGETEVKVVFLNDSVMATSGHFQ